MRDVRSDGETGRSTTKLPTWFWILVPAVVLSVIGVVLYNFILATMVQMIRNG